MEISRHFLSPRCIPEVTRENRTSPSRSRAPDTRLHRPVEALDYLLLSICLRYPSPRKDVLLKMFLPFSTHMISRDINCFSVSSWLPASCTHQNSTLITDSFLRMDFLRFHFLACRNFFIEYFSAIPLYSSIVED